MTRRSPGRSIALLLVFALGSGCSAKISLDPPSVTAAAPASSPSPIPTPTPTSGSARAALGLLRVKGRAPKTGYDRDQFGPAWSDIDRNGCDQRNDILRRDLTALHTKPGTHGCVAAGGRLISPYTGATIDFTRGDDRVQIDHLVALGDAWQTGADAWTSATRTAFANDPLELLAVDSFSNESKGDGDAATWLPPAKGYRCRYVARQIAVKARYRLWVTAAERDAMARVLIGCPGQLLPARADTAIPGLRPVGEPTPSGSLPVVDPGSYCSPEGAHGVTDTGTLMVCSVKAGADRARWRRA